MKLLFALLVTLIIAVGKGNARETRIVPLEGAPPNEGRVEVKVKGVWGYVCNYKFTIASAQVACRSLGYRGYSAPVFEPKYKSGGKRILLGKTNCNGHEASLFDCEEAKSAMGSSGACKGPDIAVVKCGLTNENAPPKPRLVDNLEIAELAGRLEFRFEGVFRPVCDTGFTQQNAEVACRHLGLSGGTVIKNGFYRFAVTKLKTFTMVDLKCNGDEKSLLDCTYDLKKECTSQRGQGLECGPAPKISDKTSGNEDGNLNGVKIGVFDHEGESIEEKNVKNMAILVNTTDAVQLENGKITSWYVHTNSAKGGVVTVGVFRQGSTKSKWKYVQGTELELLTKGSHTKKLLPAEYIDVQKGDILGIIASDQQPISMRRNPCENGKATTYRRKLNDKPEEGDEIILRANPNHPACKTFFLGAVIEEFKK